MTFEFTVFSDDVRPYSSLVHNVFDNGKDLVLSSADLGGRVAFTEGNGTVLDSLEVDCYTEWGAKFVISCIATTDGLRRVIFFIGDAVYTEGGG